MYSQRHLIFKELKIKIMLLKKFIVKIYCNNDYYQIYFLYCH